MRYIQKIQQVLTIFLFFGITSPLLAQPTEADAEIIASIQWESTPVVTGISYKKCEAITLFGSLQSIVIVEIDTAIADLQYLLDYTSDYMPVSVLAERNQAIVAINGTYFYSNGSSQHFIKIDDQVCFHTASVEFDTRASGVFTVTDGKPKVSTWSREKEAEQAGDAQYALVCGPVLIIDGEFIDLWDDQYITHDRHPRSSVGITGDGKLLIIAVDGRQSARAAGMDLFELRFFMKELGCVEAMNLDGGGSTALYVKGAPNQGIVNVPIDSNTPGKERNVGNILYIADPSAPKPFSVTNHAPGGAAGMRMWVKASGNVTKDQDNKLEAPYLFDYTGFNVFDLEKRTDDAKIEWIPDRINSYPVLSFDSASVLKSGRRVEYSTFYSVNTLNKRGTLLGFDEFGSSYTKLRYFLMADENNVYVHDGSSQSSGLNYNYIPYQEDFDQRLHLFSSSYGKQMDDFIVNGEDQRTTASDFCKREKINATAQIGARNSYPTYPTTNNLFFRGEVAEIIIYPDTLTATKHNRVESYLAIKYGITMMDPKYKYVSSYGDSWWSGNLSAYTSYSNYITCITRDDKSDLYQPVSKGTGNQDLPYSGSLLTLIHGGDPENPASLDNQYYLTAGCTLDDLSLRADIVSEAITYEVMQRHWKLNTASQSEAFAVILDIPEALQPFLNDVNAGVLLRSTTDTYVTGTLNQEKTQLTVANLSAKKGDLLYLVVNKNGQSNSIGTETVADVYIGYQSDRQRLLVNTFRDLETYCDVFSITGEKILSLPFTGILEFSIPHVASGLYILQVRSEKNQVLKSQKIAIAN